MGAEGKKDNRWCRRDVDDWKENIRRHDWNDKTVAQRTKQRNVKKEGGDSGVTEEEPWGRRWGRRWMKEGLKVTDEEEEEESGELKQKCY